MHVYQETPQAFSFILGDETFFASSLLSFINSKRKFLYEFNFDKLVEYTVDVKSKKFAVKASANFFVQITKVEVI